MGSETKLLSRISHYFIVPMLGLGFALALSIVANAQTTAPEVDTYGRWVNGITEPWWLPDSVAKETVSVVQSKWSSIEAEQKTGRDNVWVGDYFIGGDTHGSYMRLSPQSGFVIVHVNKCEARVMGFSYGKVILSPTLIQFLPEETLSASSTHHGHKASDTLRFLPVTWHRLRYLIPEDKIADFGDYVAGLGEYNDPTFSLIEYAQFFTKSEIEGPGLVDDQPAKTQPTPGALPFNAPVVPPGYERFIKKPIDAKIISRGRSYIRHDPENEWWNNLTVPVTINAGAAQGLKEKLMLRVLGGAGFGGGDEFVRITRVDLRSARGVIERPVRKQPCVKFDPADDCQDPEYSPVQIGWKVTTNPVREDPMSDR